MPLPDGELDAVLTIARTREPKLSWYLEAGMLCCQDIDYPGNRKPTAGVKLAVLETDIETEMPFTSRESIRIALVDGAINTLSRVKEKESATTS